MTTSFLEVDGSFGEGGGQILRTSVSLSVALNRPVTIKNIRAKRSVTGLRPQHVAAIKALTLLSDANVQGLSIGSTTLTFSPKDIHSRKIRIDVGSAGSITLILQAVIIACAVAKSGAELDLSGGTDVKWSPTSDYFLHVALPTYRFAGVGAVVEVLKRGFYPVGGGQVRAKIHPTLNINPIEMLESRFEPPSLISVCANLPAHVAERQLSSATQYLSKLDVPYKETSVEVATAPSPGSSIAIYSIGASGPFIGSDSIGEKGKRAELVGLEAAKQFCETVVSKAPLDQHIGDMIVPLLFFANGESRLRVQRSTLHLTTNLHIAHLFSNRKYSVSDLPDGTAIVTISGAQ